MAILNSTAIPWQLLNERAGVYRTRAPRRHARRQIAPGLHHYSGLHWNRNSFCNRGRTDYKKVCNIYRNPTIHGQSNKSGQKNWWKELECDCTVSHNHNAIGPIPTARNYRTRGHKSLPRMAGSYLNPSILAQS